MISAVQTHTMSDLHNTSLDQHEYWEIQADKEAALAIAELNTENCWRHDGFDTYYRAVCDQATKQAADPLYGGFDYDGAFDDGTPLEMIIEAYQDGDSAAETAEALLQGEAEQAAEDIVRDGGIF
jgi:chloramphenicol 3-O-phosphotransferase